MAYYPYAVEKGAIYDLVAPNGAAAVFNDPTDADYVGMLADLSGLDGAEVRESSQDLTEADGGSHGYFYFARRPIVLTARIFGHASVAERNLRIDRAKRASLAMRGDSILSWRPSTRRENLLLNPTMTLDTANYTVTAAGSPTLTRLVSPASSVPGWGGGAGTGWQWSGTMTNITGWFGVHGAGPLTYTGNKVVPVSPGKKYSVRGFTRLVSVTSGTVSALRILVWWVKADGTLASTSSNNAQVVNSPVAGATEYDMSGVVTAPAQAVGGVVGFYIDATNPTTFEARGSKFSMEEISGSTATTYIDGDVAGNYWQGNRGASPSGDFIEMYTTCRRQQRFQESGDWVKEIQVPLVSEYATLFSTYQKTITGTPAILENRGNYDAYPILEFTGAGTNPRVTDNTGGDFRTTGLTLAAAEVVQFDMLNHTGVFTVGARAGQSANRYIDWANTKWVDLPGNASTTLTLAAGSGTVKYYWRDVWA